LLGSFGGAKEMNNKSLGEQNSPALLGISSILFASTPHSSQQAVLSTQSF